MVVVTGSVHFGKESKNICFKRVKLDMSEFPSLRCQANSWIWESVAQWRNGIFICFYVD